jgi:hypothetical protein
MRTRHGLTRDDVVEAGAPRAQVGHAFRVWTGSFVGHVVGETRECVNGRDVRPHRRRKQM